MSKVTYCSIYKFPNSVIPARVRIHKNEVHLMRLDSRFRGNDGTLLFGEYLILRGQHGLFLSTQSF